MSRRVILDKVGVHCLNDHGFGKPCDGHRIKLEHHITSDTVNLTVDNEHYTFDEVIWDEIIKAEIADDKAIEDRKK